MNPKYRKTEKVIFRVSEPVLKQIKERINEISKDDNIHSVSTYLRECVSIELKDNLIGKQK